MGDTMTSLLNNSRPPVFCPGCGHDLVVRKLDTALQRMELSGDKVVIVSDIGCSGLFDTFFNSHAFHGLHGRALTYATGLKMARPELTVITVMGDGGLGIGGAHVLSSCRRNLDITLLVLNNFNYGMTGGQCSVTTPVEAQTASGFLNQLDAPLDICRVAESAGTPYLVRTIATDKELAEQLAGAIEYPGFALMDIWGLCPGRYTKRNRISTTQLKSQMKSMHPVSDGPVLENEREEYGAHYRRLASATSPVIRDGGITTTCERIVDQRREVLLLGAAGQYINTAGEVLCLAGMSGGLQVSQKNDYPITVLRGHSICEVVLEPESIGYTGISKPSVVIAVSVEGVTRRKGVFALLEKDDLVIKPCDLDIPTTDARIIEIDCREQGIKPSQMALAALAALAGDDCIVTLKMLQLGLAARFTGKLLEDALGVLKKMR